MNRKPLTIGGKQYDKGLRAQRPATVKIPAGATRFVAIVGLDDESHKSSRTGMMFEVYGDVKEMGEQPVLLGKSPVLCDQTVRSWAFDLELNPRYKELRLISTFPKNQSPFSISIPAPTFYNEGSLLLLWVFVEVLVGNVFTGPDALLGPWGGGFAPKRSGWRQAQV